MAAAYASYLLLYEEGAFHRLEILQAFQADPDAVLVIMDKVVAYLLEKETITGAEMVAIIEGRDPSTVEDAYASTRPQEGFRPSTPDVIEPAAKKVHMISQKIEAPAQPEDAPASAEPQAAPDASSEDDAPNAPSSGSEAAPGEQPKDPQ